MSAGLVFDTAVALWIGRPIRHGYRIHGVVEISLRARQQCSAGRVDYEVGGVSSDQRIIDGLHEPGS
jgi:hypothetical protein